MMYRYNLRFSAPVHFGLEGIGQERLEHRMRSDSLWGAVIQKWLLLFDDDADDLCLHPPFHVSSTFPVIGGVAFFPLPVGAVDHLISESAGSDRPEVSVKDLKKIRFLAEPLFNRVVSGSAMTFADIRGGMVFPKPSDEDDSAPAHTSSAVTHRPRLEVDRLRGGGVEGQFFYCSEQFFKSDSGLFFLGTFEDDEARAKLEAALRLLADSGLGADRSVGRGYFTFSVQPYKPPKVSGANSFLLLSLFHPREEEVDAGVLESPAAYSLVKRYGHAASHGTTRFRRHDLWMLEEGSVVGTRPEGDIVTVLERSDELGIPHNVYRNGRAFYLPIRPVSEVRP